ncbi:MAG: DUF2834 domain-containing protein [Pseudomonadota bacterium]
MATIRIVYLLLAIIGAILPWAYFATWFSINGWSLPGMVDAWNVSAATTGLVYDLTVAYVALVIWCVYESAMAKRWFDMIIVPVAGIAIGVSCALPLFLFLRSRDDPKTGIIG